MTNINIAIAKLHKTYTKESINNFLKNDWGKCKYKNEASWKAFVKHSKLLVKKPLENNEDIIYLVNDLPMPNWKIYVIVDYLRIIYGITLTNDEREYFEIALAYLIHHKKVPFENIKTAIKNLIPLKENFMQKFKSAKSLTTDEAIETIGKMLTEYESEI